MQDISVIHSRKSVEQLLNDAVPSGHLHRKAMGETIRFNPNLKKFFVENELGFIISLSDDRKTVYLVGGKGDKFNKVRKGSNQKAPSFTHILDYVYHNETMYEKASFEKTNRYALEFTSMRGDNYVWQIVPQAPVQEREYTEEERQEARERLARSLNRVESSQPIEETVS